MTSENAVALQPGVGSAHAAEGTAWVDTRPEPAAMNAHLAAGGDPYELVERPRWFSFSSFDTFARCPRQYALRYLCSQPEERIVWPAAEYGSAAHAAFERFTRERRERAERGEPAPTREELGAWFEDAFALTSLPAAPDAETWRGRVGPMLDVFWAGEQPEGWFLPEVAAVAVAPAPDTLGEELRFRLPLELDDETQVVVTGYIDRVDRLPAGDVEVLDYKSGNGDPARAATSLQLGIYALGCRDALGLGRPARVTLYYVERGIRAGAERSDAELDELRADLASRARTIRSSGFPETPGQWACRWCDFAAACGKAVAVEA